MKQKPDLGLEGVRHIAKLWQVDHGRVEWSEDGFEWWPGRFRVSVHSDKHPDETAGLVWRLTVRTELLKDLSADDEKIQKEIFMLASLAPSYAWVYPPAELAKLPFLQGAANRPETRDEAASLLGRTVWLQSTVYLNEDTAVWFPDFLGRLAILQPADAESQAEPAAELLGGRPNVSQFSETSPDRLADLINLPRAVYGPAGDQPNRWKGTDEFVQIAELFGQNDLWFAVGDPDGVTLETPIGPHTAMIRLRTDVPHPFLGSGLLASVHLPFTSEEMAKHESLWLNFTESAFWTNVPLLASWHPEQPADGMFEVCSAFFIPNAMYQPLIATNAALWQLSRARWVKQQRWPNLKDRPIIDILRDRHPEAFRQG